MTNKPVNTISGEHPTVQQRPAVKLVDVWDPKTGEKHSMTQPNARDKLRLDGWLAADPALSSKKVDNVDVPDQVGAEVAPAMPKSDATKYLQLLRATLVGLDVTPDARWGKKRMIDEITSRGGTVPVEK